MWSFGSYFYVKYPLNTVLHIKILLYAVFLAFYLWYWPKQKHACMFLLNYIFIKHLFLITLLSYAILYGFCTT